MYNVIILRINIYICLKCCVFLLLYYCIWDICNTSECIFEDSSHQNLFHKHWENVCNIHNVVFVIRWLLRKNTASDRMFLPKLYWNILFINIRRHKQGIWGHHWEDFIQQNILFYPRTSHYSKKYSLRV